MSLSRTPSRSIASSAPTTGRSSVISSASMQRKMHKKEFAKYYADLCHLQHSHPIQAIKQNLERGVLDIVGDRIKFDDWFPVVTALRWDQSLHRVAVRLKHRSNYALIDADTELKAKAVSKQPVLTTKFVLYWMVEAIKKVLIQSTFITVLELEGLPLRGDFVNLLSQGLLETRSLQHLSLNKCGIMDEGADVVCMAVRNAPSIISLDLSSCDLTERGAEYVGKLISFQKLNRYSEAWKQTLRYRDPDVEAMPGLRRLTLNNNPNIGDSGLLFLVEEVRDDLWLRALDIQNIGLTEVGGNQLVLLVRNNPNLNVVDARGNPALPDHCLTEMISTLAINNADKGDSEYCWLADPCGGGDAHKKPTPRSSRHRSWAPPVKIPKAAVRPSTISFDPSIGNASSYSRCQTSLSQTELPTWRLQKEAQQRENAALRRQINELNDILSLEVKQKSHILEENASLRNALLKCQVEKKQLDEELANKVVLSQETLSVLEETISRLVDMYSSKEDASVSDAPVLLKEMRRVLKKGNSKADLNGCVESHTNKSHKNKLTQDTIWEEEEPLSSPERKNSSVETLRGLEVGRKLSKAQELFSQLLNASDEPKFKTIGNESSSEEST